MTLAYIFYVRIVKINIIVRCHNSLFNIELLWYDKCIRKVFLNGVTSGTLILSVVIFLKGNIFKGDNIQDIFEINCDFINTVCMFFLLFWNKRSLFLEKLILSNIENMKI